jgi:hypothetical protein
MRKKTTETTREMIERQRKGAGRVAGREASAMKLGKSEARHRTREQKYVVDMHGCTGVKGNVERTHVVQAGIFRGYSSIL